MSVSTGMAPPASVRWYVFFVGLQILLPWFLLNSLAPPGLLIGALVGVAVWLGYYFGWLAALVVAALNLGLRIASLITDQLMISALIGTHLGWIMLGNVTLGMLQIAALSLPSTRKWVSRPH